MTKQHTQERHYAWTIVACCILVYFATSIVGVKLGNFITPVVNDFGIQVRQITLVSGIECAVMAVLYPVAGKALNSIKLRYVVVPALLLMLLGMFLMGSYTSIYGFYISAVMSGIGSAFTQYLAMPLIINMWFKKKTGTALGICVSSGNAFGIIFNLLSAQLIERVGWRSAYHILPLIPLVVAIPFIFIFLKSPEEKGCRPYGEEEMERGRSTAAQRWGVTRRQAFLLPMLYLGWAACLFYSVGSSVPMYVATFATMELGTSIGFGSIASSICSAGAVVGGYLLGRINDKFGVKAGMAWGMAFMAVGMAGMMLSIQNSALLLPACLITGVGGINMYGVQAPLIARTVVGDRYYPEIWSILMIGNSMIAALVAGPIGAIYDVSGSFTGAFILGIVTYVAAFFVGSIAIGMSKSYRAKHETRQEKVRR